VKGVINQLIYPMKYLKKYNQEKAMVCAKNNCITVYGEPARIINNIAVFTALFIGIAIIAKAIR